MYMYVSFSCPLSAVSTAIFASRYSYYSISKVYMIDNFLHRSKLESSVQFRIFAPMFGIVYQHLAKCVASVANVLDVSLIKIIFDQNRLAFENM